MVSNGIPAYVLGVGLTKFIKPRRLRGYPEMGYEAGVKAMLDAQINYDDVETGVACSCMAGTSSGQRIFYQFGMSTYVVSCKALTQKSGVTIKQYPNIQHAQCLRYWIDRPTPRKDTYQRRRRRLCSRDRLRADAGRTHRGQIGLAIPDGAERQDDGRDAWP